MSCNIIVLAVSEFEQALIKWQLRRVQTEFLLRSEDVSLYF